MSIFVLQYKVARHSEKVHDFSFQITPESLKKNHELIIKLEDDPYSESQNTFLINFCFNKKTDCTEINQINDVESITLTQKWKRTNLYDSEYLTQQSWKDEIQRLTKNLDDLEVILKYEKETMDSLSHGRIQRLNEKIAQHKKDIESIKNESCEIDYSETIDVKSVVLPKSKLGRMSLNESGRFCTFYDALKVDFYWNVNELINLNIFNVQDVENMTVTKTNTTYHKKVIPKLNIEEKIKYRRLY